MSPKATEWTRFLAPIALSVFLSLVSFAGWTYARGTDQGAVVAHLSNHDIHLGRSDIERLARIEEGINVLRQDVAELKAKSR